jgi:hypothetical protein
MRHVVSTNQLVIWPATNSARHGRQPASLTRRRSRQLRLIRRQGIGTPTRPRTPATRTAELAQHPPSGQSPFSLGTAGSVGRSAGGAGGLRVTVESVAVPDDLHRLTWSDGRLLPFRSPDPANWRVCAGQP